jgi:succinyldiaminopimelate transaminase
MKSRLPAFPWDRLERYKKLAASHSGGLIDLSLGAPVDPVPSAVQRALSEAARFEQLTHAQAEAAFQRAAADWLWRRHSVRVDPSAVVATLGSKEVLAWLPRLAGASSGSRVIHPELAYPTYAMGAALADAEPIPCDTPELLDAERVTLLWINSPSNPTGRVLSPERMAELVRWARNRDVLLASDECYIDLGPDTSPPLSVLHPQVCQGDHNGLLAVHTLSKRSNLAGYRAGFLTGDTQITERLGRWRRAIGLVPAVPILVAMACALGDDKHSDQQRERYASRRKRLASAFAATGWQVADSQAGMYLWVTHPAYDCWDATTAMANRGILVAPGEFYGSSGCRHIRVALTASDERIIEAGRRLQTPINGSTSGI